MKPMLTPNGQQLMNEFLRLQPQLQQLEHEAFSQLQDVLKAQGVELNAIESRVKAEASLRGKLERKGDKYHSLSDITDLVGIRIITFYTDDVDKVAGIVKRLFAVDWSNSIDKRKAHELTSFGYNSLHYICRLKGDGPLSSIPFEIQMRTALQHVWSAIEHDIGYKGVVQLPPEFRRQFSRLAGMLELADDEFSRLRITMTEYRRQVQSLVKSGKLDEVPLSNDSFRSYLELRPFDRLNQRIAAINQAELFPVSLMMFMPLFFIRKTYTWSLLALSVALLVRWEITFYLHPERFSEKTNDYLRCANCTEKLCAHKTQLKSLWKQIEEYSAKRIERLRK